MKAFSENQLLYLNLHIGNCGIIDVQPLANLFDNQRRLVSVQLELQDNLVENYDVLLDSLQDSIQIETLFINFIINAKELKEKQYEPLNGAALQDKFTKYQQLQFLRVYVEECDKHYINFPISIPDCEPRLRITKNKGLVSCSYKQCLKQCKSCFSNYANCASCYDDKGYYLEENISTNFNCVKSCKIGYKVEEQKKKCLECEVSNCEKCQSGITSCDKCKDGYYVEKKDGLYHWGVTSCLKEEKEQFNSDFIYIIIGVTFLVILVILSIFLVKMKLKLKSQSQLKQKLIDSPEDKDSKQSETIKDSTVDDKIISKENGVTIISKKQFKLIYQKVSPLGQGTFGIVDKYKYNQKKEVAIKFIKGIDNIDKLIQGFQEAEGIKFIHKHCRKYVIKLVDFFIIGNSEDMQKNNKKLAHMIIENSSISSTSSSRNSSQIVGLKELVQQKINQNSSNKSQQNQNQNQNQNVLQISSNPHSINSQEEEENNEDIESQKLSSSIKLALVFELAEKSLYQEIQERIINKKIFEQEEIIGIIKNMSQVFDLLHNKLQIAHRDIKPSNILKSGTKWKIADLGLMKFMNQYDYATNNHSLKGTLNYISPEQKENYINQLQGKQEQSSYNPYKSDVFSFGLTMYQVVTLKNVGNINMNPDTLSHAIRNNLLKNTDVNINILNHITRMLQWNPNDRITFQELNLIYQFI